MFTSTSHAQLYVRVMVKILAVCCVTVLNHELCVETSLQMQINLAADREQTVRVQK